jgi:GNAT superfamily N-acetyltransferase
MRGRSHDLEGVLDTSQTAPPVVPDGGERVADSSAADARDESEPTQRGDSESDPEFPHPPYDFVDDEGRDIDVRVLDDDTQALVEMYHKFDQEDRAQGIPPRSESRLNSWIETLADEGLNLVAWHGEDAVAHAVLIPMEDARWELAIFVRSDYQEAHIGSNLMECLMGYGQDNGVERIWLSVEEHNTVALNLYRSFGFETLSGEIEYKMEREI